MSEKGHITVAEMPVGRAGIVAEVSGGEGLVRHLESVGIRVGKRVTKLSSIFMRGPVTLEVDRARVAVGFGMAKRIIVKLEERKMRILLMGNPNVGKSVVFSRLTGIRVIVSNYPGTTVEFTKGFMKLDGEPVEIIDVPGTYSLEPTNKAEEVATGMLQDGDVVVNVVDATNLERNLYLTLELIERGIPMLVALNMWDEAKHKGIGIDIKKLKELLGVPAIATVAVTGEGIKELVNRLKEVISGHG